MSSFFTTMTGGEEVRRRRRQGPGIPASFELVTERTGSLSLGLYKTAPGEADFEVDWGDGTPKTTGSGVLPHSYASAGQKTITVRRLGPDWSGLQRLTAQTCDLVGPIPPELGLMENMTALSLNANRLSGPIPPELGQLSSLTTLHLHANQLTGAIPPELGALSNLTLLNLFNNRLTGEVPASLGTLGKVSELMLYQNQLTGWEPGFNAAGLTSCVYFYGDRNQFTSLPPGLDASPTRAVNFGENAITGTAPVLPYAVHVRMPANQLTGELPAGLFTGTVKWLDLGNNAGLTGPIPAAIASAPSLDTLQLRHTGLSGPLPAELGQLPALKTLDLENTPVSGRLPAGLGASPLERVTPAYSGVTGIEPGALTSRFLSTVYFQGCPLTQADVDAVLADLRQSYDNRQGTNTATRTALVDLTGTATPSADGMANADFLRSVGWTINLT